MPFKTVTSWNESKGVISFPYPPHSFVFLPGTHPTGNSCSLPNLLVNNPRSFFFWHSFSLLGMGCPKNLRRNYLHVHVKTPLLDDVRVESKGESKSIPNTRYSQNIDMSRLRYHLFWWRSILFHLRVHQPPPPPHPYHHHPLNDTDDLKSTLKDCS